MGTRWGHLVTLWGRTVEDVEALLELQQFEGAARPPAALLGQAVINVPFVLGAAAHGGLLEQTGPERDNRNQQGLKGTNRNQQGLKGTTGSERDKQETTGPEGNNRA